MKNTMRIIASILVSLLLMGGIVGILAICSGCSTTQEEVTPIPVPTTDYKTAIIGKWEGFASQNLEHSVQFEYKPNGKVEIFVKKKDKYVLVPSESTYVIYDNKILHVMWSIKKNKKTTLTGEDFWHITITGKVMHLSVKKVSTDGGSYVISLTMKKIN